MSALAAYYQKSFPRLHIVEMDGIEILDEHVIHRNNSYCRVRQWLRGVHPELGVIVKGWTGLETLVEKDVIRPMKTFMVVDK